MMRYAIVARGGSVNLILISICNWFRPRGVENSTQGNLSTRSIVFSSLWWGLLWSVMYCLMEISSASGPSSAFPLALWNCVKLPFNDADSDQLWPSIVWHLGVWSPIGLHVQFFHGGLLSWSNCGPPWDYMSAEFLILRDARRRMTRQHYF